MLFLRQGTLRSSIIVVSAMLLLTSWKAGAAQFDIHGPPGSSAFGSSVLALPNGNIVVLDPGYSIPSGAEEVGAVYLYSPEGTLISTVTGSSAHDKAGSGGVQVLTNGNFVISSPLWSNAGVALAGAVTWCSGTTGLNGSISPANSLVGGTANDGVGYDITAKSSTIIALANGNYVVGSPFWDNGTVANAGAATWCDGAAGLSGVVSAVNSLVGSTTDDQLGYNKYYDSHRPYICALSNGNYVVCSPFWDNGTEVDAGAATWCNGLTGRTGLITADNSLIGSAYDVIGFKSAVALTIGHYVVLSPRYQSVGAATWGDGTTGISGTVSAANSLVGASLNDHVGEGGVTALTNGNYVVGSPVWNNGGVSVGAVTWCKGDGSTVGPVTVTNSLYGDNQHDSIGAYAVITDPDVYFIEPAPAVALSNGNYAVGSRHWHSDLGAVTWGNGNGGTSGLVSAANSLVGSEAAISQPLQIIPLTNGNYVVQRSWHLYSGAVTWGNGSGGTTGMVSASNSLVGGSSMDLVGWGGVTALANGNYVVASPSWKDAKGSSVGAVTLVDGSVGLTGYISSANSRTGTAASPFYVSGISALNDGNYVITSAFDGKGAVTWCDGTKTPPAVVGPANSLVGSTPGDGLGLRSYANGSRKVLVTASSDSRFVSQSPAWDNGAILDGGAVTLGYAGSVGELSTVNSVLGTVVPTQPVNDSSYPLPLRYAYDPVHGRLVVGRAASQIVTVLVPGPAIKVSDAHANVLHNGDVATFPYVAPGGTASQSFTLSNPGLGDLTGLGLSITGPDHAEFTVSSSPAGLVTGPGGTTTFTLQFAPTSGGVKSAMVSIASNDDSGNAAFAIQLMSASPALELTRQAIPPIPVATGDPQDFGPVAVAASFTQTYTITNNGGAALSLANMAITGGNSSDFSFSAGGLGSSLASHGQAAFTVTFAPTAPGQRTSSLHLESNDPAHSSIDLPLTGNATLSAGIISFSEAIYSTGHGSSSIVLTINRTNGTLPTSATVSTSNGTASTVPPFVAAVDTGVTATSDYLGINGQLVNFGENETTKTVSVTLIPRSGTALPNKRFTASLSGLVGGAVPGIDQAAIQILAADSTRPSLTVSSPAATLISSTLPVKVSGIAGDAHGVAKVVATLNGGPAQEIPLGPASRSTAVPFSLDIVPLSGANTLQVTAFDEKGNATTVVRQFTFVRRFTLSITRSIFRSEQGDDERKAAVIALAAAPATAATALSSMLDSRVVPGTLVTLTATPARSFYFSHWQGLPPGASLLGNKVTFSMPASGLTITAVVAHHLFEAATSGSATYSALVHPAGDTPSSNATEGFFTATLNRTSGAITGKAQIDGVSQPFIGIMYADQSICFTIGTNRLPVLSFGGRTLALAYQEVFQQGQPRQQIVATVTKGTATSEGTGLAATYSATQPLASSSGLLNTSTGGSMTVIMPSKNQIPPKNHATYPQGTGIGFLTLTKSGSVNFVGTLADGTAFTASSTLSGPYGYLGNCPIFAQILTPGSATTRSGSFGGLLNVSHQAGSDVSGINFLWFRPTVIALTKPATSAAATNLYTAGWPGGVTVDPVGVLYSSTTTAQTCLGLATVNASTGNASLALSAGKLTAPVAITTFNILKNAVTKIPFNDPKYGLAITPSTGAFTGSFTPNWASPSPVKPVFKGVILQAGSDRGGYGFFLSNAVGDTDPESGKVTLGAP